MLSNGSTYTITAPSPAAGAGEGGASSVNVKFVALTEEYAAPDQLAQALISNGCTSQLGLLADTLEASAQ